MSWFRSARIRKDDYELWHEISTNARVQQLARWEKSLSETQPTFTHRVEVRRPTVWPACVDCGAPSEAHRSDVPSFGGSPHVVIEYPSNVCPNGPHEVTP